MMDKQILRRRFQTANSLRVDFRGKYRTQHKGFHFLRFTRPMHFETKIARGEVE